MSDFIANIKAQLDLGTAESEMQSFINKYKNDAIKLKVDIDTTSVGGNNLNQQIQKQFQNAGKTASSSFANAFKNNNYKGDLLNFAEYQKQIKAIKNSFSDTIQSNVKDVTKKEANSYANAYYNEIKKANTAIQKEQEKAYEASQKKIKSQQDAYYKQMFEQQFKNRHTKSPELTAMSEYYTQLQKEQEKAYKAAEKFSKLDGEIAANRTLTWKKNNSAAKEYFDTLDELASKQRNATSADELKEYTKQVNAIKTEAASLGKTGSSFFNDLSRGFKQIGQFALTYGGIQKGVDMIMDSVSELKEIDSILTEISKTSDLTNSQIKELGANSFEAASQWGRTAKDYLLGVQEMSRSGYYGDQAEKMAQTSILAQAAGDLDADMANSYLLASNAAYQYQGNVEKLNALLDGQNMITNRNSVSMQDMAEATTRAASMASELGVSENELSAIIGTMTARTKADGGEIGNAIKSLLINVENINNDKIAGTFEKIGVAQTEMVNGFEQMRNPIDILEDLAKAFNSLDESDPLRTEILTNIGQKWQANKLSALLSGWSDYEKMLQDYAEGTGSAAIEAEKSANNWEGSVNKLSNAFTGLVQNFANSDVIISVTNLLTDLVSTIDDVTGAVGPLASILGGFGIVQGIKGGGKSSMQSYSFLTYATEEFSGDVYELCIA